MFKFKNLVFTNKGSGGVGSCTTFDNGMTVSVQASKTNYCSPREDRYHENDYESFEIAVWDEVGNWRTREFMDDPKHGDDVAGWQSREQIDEVLRKVQKFWELKPVPEDMKNLISESRETLDIRIEHTK
jgi:hypothetical protein